MIRSYLPALVFLGLGAILGLVFVTANSFLGRFLRRNPTPRSQGDPYECGLPSEVRQNFRFGISFYLVAMLFILFDIETILLYPVALQRAPSPHVDVGDQQQHDEDDRLDQREGPERVQLDRDREQEDDLDVEQDEQHRDQVEADPEAEALAHLGRQAALVGLALDLVGTLRAEQAVRVREGSADPNAQKQEDKGWQVALQHSRREV